MRNAGRSIAQGDGVGREGVEVKCFDQSVRILVDTNVDMHFILSVSRTSTVRKLRGEILICVARFMDCWIEVVDWVVCGNFAIEQVFCLKFRGQIGVSTELVKAAQRHCYPDRRDINIGQLAVCGGHYRYHLFFLFKKFSVGPMRSCTQKSSTTIRGS